MDATLPPGPAQLQAPEATPGEVIRQQASTADYMVLRIAVIGLIVAIVLSLSGVIGLSAWARDVPDALIAVGSAAVGALATMLVRPPLGR